MKNEPAFPTTKKYESCAGRNGHTEYLEGMTLRDYFAAKAMQANADDYQSQPEHMARRAYKIADAMLTERAK